MRAWLRASAVGIRWGIRPALWWFGDSSQECFGSRTFTDPWLNMNDKGQSFTTSDKEHSRRQWCVSSGGCRFEGSVRGTGPLPPVPSVRRRQLGHEGAGRRGPPRPARARRPPRRSVGRTAAVAGGAALAEAIPAEDPGEGPLPSPGPGGTLGCPILQPPPSAIPISSPTQCGRITKSSTNHFSSESLCHCGRFFPASGPAIATGGVPACLRGVRGHPSGGLVVPAGPDLQGRAPPPNTGAARRGCRGSSRVRRRAALPEGSLSAPEDEWISVWWRWDGARILFPNPSCRPAGPPPRRPPPPCRCPRLRRRRQSALSHQSNQTVVDNIGVGTFIWSSIQS